MQPSYIFLDEVDSGLDVDAFRSVAALLKELDSDENSLVIITHYFTILDHIDVDRVFVLQEWEVVKEWGPEIADEIKANGFWS